jgi:hypothetical protein
MALWLLIVASLVLQETATTTAAFTLAVQGHLSLWVIHVLWAGITMGDMYLGFTLGNRVRTRYRTSRIVRWGNRLAFKLRRPLGRYGIGFVLAALAIINFPYVNTFIAPWLGARLKTSLFFTLIGNGIWYAVVWLAVLGANSFLKGPYAIIFAMGILGVLFYSAKVLAGRVERV